MPRSRSTTTTRITGFGAVALVLVCVGTTALASPSRHDRSHGERRTPACRGANLVGAIAGGGAAAGNDDVKVAIVNVGPSTCRLGGYAGIIGIRGGHEHRLRHVVHGTFFGNLEPTTLAPRMTGALILGTEGGCQALNGASRALDKAELASHSYVGLILALPDRTGDVRIPELRFQNACTLSVSRLGWNAGFSL